MVSKRKTRRDRNAMTLDLSKLSLSDHPETVESKEGANLDRFSHIQKSPAKLRKNQYNLKTNLYKISTEDRLIHRYDIHQTLIIKNSEGATKKEIDLTPSKANSDVQRNFIRLEAVDKCIKSNKLLSNEMDYCYDAAATLFCVSEIEFDGKRSFEVEADDFNYVHLLFKRYDDTKILIRVTFKPAGIPFRINDTSVDINVRKQFLEIVTSFPILRGGFFEMGDSIIAFDLPDYMRIELAYGLEARCGLSKSVKFIEGSDGRRALDSNPHLNLDVSNSVFYKVQSVYTTFKILAQNRNNTFEDFSNYFKGLRLNYRFKDKRSQFIAYGLSQQPLKALYDEKDGQKVKYLDAFFDKSDVAELDVNCPAIISRKTVQGKPKLYYFPMEHLFVANFQKLPITQQYIDPPAAMLPKIRVKLARDYMGEIGFLNRGSAFNSFLRNFGVSVCDNVLEVTGFVKEKPKVVYGSSRPVDPKPDTGGWRINERDRYVVPGKCKTIFFAYRCKSDIADAASKVIVGLLKARGFLFDDFVGREIKRFNELEKLFHDVSKMPGFNFIIFIDEKYHKDHDRLKLTERCYQVSSQQIQSQVAAKLPVKKATLSNIVNKINLKCGGLNHCIIPDSFSSNRWLNKRDMLIMGYDVAHPTGKQTRAQKFGEELPTPSVVGFSWNGTSHPECFIGDFAYQEARRETVNGRLINIYVKHMLEMFTVQNALPKYFIIVRDGVSEGQYNMVLNEEFADIKEACEEFARVKKINWLPKFMVFVVTKRHHIRLYNNDNGVPSNPIPGTVADTIIVKKDVSEFYMLSHKVVQGTGKLPSYQILHDDIEMSMDEAQSLMFALTYNHQIIEAPISLPEPVYQADLWADRGARMFKTFEQMYALPKASNGGLDYLEMTKKLSYRETRLAKTRINA